MVRVFDKEINVTCLDCILKHRRTYFMTVRAWNKAGLFNVATSGGVTVDLTAPVGGKVSLNKTYTSCIGHCGLTAEFSEFEDEESGVGLCEFKVNTMNELTVMRDQLATNEYQIKANNLTLEHGQSYRIGVACYNDVGQRSLDVFSPPIRIDNTPPEEVRSVRIKHNIYP